MRLIWNLRDGNAILECVRFSEKKSDQPFFYRERNCFDLQRRARMS